MRQSPVKTLCLLRARSTSKIFAVGASENLVQVMEIFGLVCTGVASMGKEYFGKKCFQGGIPVLEPGELFFAHVVVLGHLGPLEDHTDSLIVSRARGRNVAYGVMIASDVMPFMCA